MESIERLGVTPIINLVGTATRYGGGLMERETRDAMSAAALKSVRLDELQAAASKIIAKTTGAEAGYVTCGASAALVLGTAACLTGLDVSRMNRLPDTMGMPNEVLISLHQISGYIRVMETTGAKLIGVGIPNDTNPPTLVHIAKAWEFESNITDRTVAICYVYLTGSHPPLEEVINVAKKYNLPVLVDAADQVPPIENLRKPISMGADLVAFSGGKGIQGPQASGILCGRRDLISAAALQSLDLAEASFESWDPPRSIIPKEKLRGLPLHGIGRGMKASKEAIIGLITALERLTEDNMAKLLDQRRIWLELIASKIRGIQGVEVEITETWPGGHPLLKVKLDESKLGFSAFEVVQRLKKGKPPIYVMELFLNQGWFILHSINLNEEHTGIVSESLYTAITG